ncbi:unnamed protein product [Triticum turgidum subsp. durum]|uniref:Uncharacterized protein n=1 Tax=Triticum turgidum subsp. durum TaxID=4567 RepID=A0A9R0ZCL7_TRITD|nr:unnamed protein product [Triticum turgidum subsp. durum]
MGSGKTGRRRRARVSWAPVPCHNQITATTDEASVNIPNLLANTTIISASPRSTPCQPNSHVIEHWRETEHHFSLELEMPKENHRMISESPWVERAAGYHVMADSVDVTWSVRRFSLCVRSIGDIYLKKSEYNMDRIFQKIGLVIALKRLALTAEPQIHVR